VADDASNPILLSDFPALVDAAERWAAAPLLALDTEFVRTRTFYHRLGLVQVGDGASVWLIDAVALVDLAPLGRVFASPGLKVLHSASEDVEVFHRALGAVPGPLFDTQVGAALAGLGSALSFQKLVAALLEVELHKAETRTDWTARPLSPAQLAYAALDVAYLLPVYERLRRRLEELGRLAWALEDSAALLDVSRLEEDHDAAYLKVRGAGRLNRRQLAALRLLAAWREGEARRRDLPRGFVVRDELMLELARRRPKSAAEIKRLPACDPRQAARHGDAWLALLADAAGLAESELPPALSKPPPAPEVKLLEESLREMVRSRAAELDLPAEVLVSRRVLGALLALNRGGSEPRLPRELAGWRRPVIGEALLAEVRSATMAHSS
jgi:ribonuclease D